MDKWPVNESDHHVGTAADSVLELLLPGNARSQDASYIGRLSTLSLSELLAEPTNLSAESAVLASSLTTLCHNEYQTFIALRDTSDTVSSSFNSILAASDDLMQAIPVLAESAKEFVSVAREIQQDRRQTSLVMEQQEKLLDILDTPQLLDTCVRNGYYQEALELAVHTETLMQRFSHIPLMADIEHEAQQALHLMTSQLLSSLRGPAKLPSLLKTVNLLRSTRDFQETELTLVFLIYRLSWLEHQLDAKCKDVEDPTKLIRGYVDVLREGVSDLVTQFETIFLARPSQDLPELRSLLSIVLNRLITSFLQQLENQLYLVKDSTSLSSIFTQVTYCSVSFSKFGLDFRPYLGPVFLEAIKALTKNALEGAASRLCDTFNEHQKKSPAAVIRDSSSLISIEYQGPWITPPSCISSVPALAGFTNDVISVLNNLRLFAPIAAFRPLLCMLDVALEQVVHGFTSSTRKLFLDEENDNFKQQAYDEANRVIQVLLLAVIPFLRGALTENLYGESIRNNPPSELLSLALSELRQLSSQIM